MKLFSAKAVNENIEPKDLGRIIMKITTDFVTNSSNSSFSVVVAIETKVVKIHSFEEDPYEYNEDEGGACRFDGDLKSIVLI